MDAHPRGADGGAGRRGDFRIREVVEHTKPDGLAKLGREGGELLVEALDPTHFGRRRMRLALACDEDAEAVGRPPFERPLANGRDQHVAGDRVQPRRRRSIGEIAEAIERKPRLREGLGGQVERCITIAAPREMKAMDPLGVPVIELAKGRCVGLCARDQLCVRPHARDSVLRF